MPRPDGTLYRWELAELRNAQKIYESAVTEHMMNKGSSSAPHYEAIEKRTFARLMAVTAKYAGCKY